MRQMKDSGIEWIGEIPAEWEVQRIKTALYVKDEKRIYLNQKYIGLENIESWTGRYKEGSIQPEGVSNIFTAGDILFGKLRPYLAKCMIPDFDGCCSTELIVLCSYQKQNNYFKWLLLSPHIIDKINAATYGTKMPRANWKIIGDIITPIPPLHEQQRIADYLDAQCARIDETMELVRQSKEKLHAYKLSLITEAVTRGLDPDVPMKDSGVPWIGEIPAGWKIIKIMYGVQSIGSGTTPSSEEDTWYQGSIPWITTSELKDSIIYDSIKHISESTLNNFSALKLHPIGSLVIAMYGATIGRMGILGVESTTNQACCVLSGENKLLIKYIFYFIFSLKETIIALAQGAGQPNLSQELIRSLRIAAPPLDEQQRIAAYLDEKCARMDALLAEKDELLGKLAEYKKSLIFECVTGKREVAA